MNTVLTRVNEISTLYILYPMITCFCLVFFLPKTYQQSWTKWQTSSVLTLHLQQWATRHLRKNLLCYGASNCFYYVMGIHFT